MKEDLVTDIKGLQKVNEELEAEFVRGEKKLKSIKLAKAEAEDSKKDKTQLADFENAIGI